MSAAETGPPTRATWVRSGYQPDGGYVISFDIGPDLAWSLAPDAAVGYAVALHAVATAAEHDAALLATLRDRSIPDELSGQVFVDVRAARPGVDEATAPLRCRPGVSAASGAPFVHLSADGAQPWQWSPADLRHHAAAVLAVVTATEEDNRLREVLIGHGLPEGSVAALIHAMGEHWPEPGEAQVATDG